MECVASEITVKVEVNGYPGLEDDILMFEDQTIVKAEEFILPNRTEESNDDECEDVWFGSRKKKSRKKPIQKDETKLVKVLQKRKEPKISLVKRKEKPVYTCHDCSTSFHTKRELQTHFKNHEVKNKNPKNVNKKSAQRTSAQSSTNTLISCKNCSLKFSSPLAQEIHECLLPIQRSEDFLETIEKERKEQTRPKRLKVKKPSNRTLNVQISISENEDNENFVDYSEPESIDDESESILKNAFLTKAPRYKNLKPELTLQELLKKPRNSSTAKARAITNLRKRMLSPKLTSRPKPKRKLTGVGKNKIRSLLRCMHCDETFKRTEFREAHMKSTHPDIQPSLPCEICPRRFYDMKSFRTHQSSHLQEKIHSCPYCEEKFNSKLRLYEHEQTHAVDKPAYCCYYCSKTFPTQLQVEKHERQTHRNNTQRFQCPHCPKVYIKKRSLKNHVVTHSEGYVKAVKSCKICEKPDFTSDVGLRRHERTHFAGFDASTSNTSHSIRKRFSCSQCGKDLASQQLLKEHETIHTGERPHKCSYCEKAFARNSNLRAHVASLHTTHKQFKCQLCEKEFSQLHQLTLHARTHTGEKPYLCPDCGKNFAVQSSMIRHRKKHTGTGIKEYNCSHCDRKFTEKKTLRRHEQQQHSVLPKFPCKYCGKAMQSIYFLEVHERIHTGEKPFSCSICCTEFRSKELLAVHNKKYHIA